MKTDTRFTPEAMFELNASVCDFMNALMMEAARVAQARLKKTWPKSHLLLAVVVKGNDVKEAEKCLLRGYNAKPKKSKH